MRLAHPNTGREGAKPHRGLNRPKLGPLGPKLQNKSVIATIPPQFRHNGPAHSTNRGGTKNVAKVEVGQMVQIAPDAPWGGTFKVIEVRRTFKNGKVEVVVDFHGKPKTFNI